MTKEEMRKEIKFPVLVPKVNEFMNMGDIGTVNYNPPAEDAWILAIVQLKPRGNSMGLYKWQILNSSLIKPTECSMGSKS